MDQVSLFTWRVPTMDAATVEAATLPEKDLERRLHDAKERLRASGLAYIATCQRVTWVLHGVGTDAEDALCNAYRILWHRRIPPPEVLSRFEAFHHMCRVASSLDALVPGEPQVLGQVKQAVHRCQEANLLGPDLRHVFDQVFRTAKEVRSQTDLFQGKMSLVPLTEDLIRNVVDGTDLPRATVIGTGQVGERTIERIRAIRNDTEIHVVSRDRSRARRFAAQHDASGHTLRRFLSDPPTPQGLIVCAMRTGSPILSTTWMMDQARIHPLTVLDLALPRNAETPTGRVPGLRLVQMDGLTRISEQRRADHQSAYEDAMQILADAVGRVRHEYDLRHHASTLHNLVVRFEDVADTRWRQIGATFDPRDPRARKWFDQTINALLHEAAQIIKDGGRQA